MSTIGPENRFIQSIHRLLPPRVYRMKNHNPYVGGVPDCWYSGDAGDLWVEYKFVVPPKRADTLVGLNLSELQKDWLRSRHAQGRNVGVIIGHPKGGLWLPGDSWEPPITSAELAAGSASKARVAAIIESLVCRI